jgi:hypothetical protein
MSRIVIVILIYYQHKTVDLIYSHHTHYRPTDIIHNTNGLHFGTFVEICERYKNTEIRLGINKNYFLNQDININRRLQRYSQIKYIKLFILDCLKNKCLCSNMVRKQITR